MTLTHMLGLASSARVKDAGAQRARCSPASSKRLSGLMLPFSQPYEIFAFSGPTLSPAVVSEGGASLLEGTSLATSGLSA
jgi:hypothetical protein